MEVLESQAENPYIENQKRFPNAYQLVELGGFYWDRVGDFTGMPISPIQGYSLSYQIKV